MRDDLTVSSAYLEVLEAQRAHLVSALEPVVGSEEIAAAQRASARLSVRLDASPLSDETADAVDRGRLPVRTSGARERDGAGWASALRLEGMPTQEIAAVEYRGVRAAQADEPRLAARLFDEPLATLRQVHRHIVSGLVADDHVGALRRTSRAVHDGAQGRTIYNAPPPARLPTLLAQLETWMRAAHGSATPLATAAVVHARLLQWQPFEAGNGRVARIASRIALRATAGDPWGVAVPERWYAADPLRYATEVAATIRRRTDLRPWSELTGEAIVGDLERLARDSGVVPANVDARALRAAASFERGAAVTLPALARTAGLARDEALVQCNRLCWAGVLRRDPGTRGLRYELQRKAKVSDRAGAEV